MTCAPFAPDRELAEHALRLCQELIRVDTTNPPGAERAAAELLADELSQAGLAPVILEGAPARANVIARLRGTGRLPPLLLTAHLDVVPADPAAWTVPPFSGAIRDGCLWGRGAIDMKNMAAMSVSLLARLSREGARFERDIIFAGVADEEAGCRFGSAFLCESHPELVRAEYALGEGGGFNFNLGSKSFYTVQVAEKGYCWMTARVRGEPGHGSVPRADSAVIKLSEAIARLGRARLPTHPTRAVEEMLAAMAGALGPAAGSVVRRLARPQVIARAAGLLPDASIARAILAMLSNTASPTGLRAGGNANVIPGIAEATIDGRMLPGQAPEELLRELSEVLGPEVELVVEKSAPAVETEPMRSPLFETIARVVSRREPEAVVVPYLLPGATDAKSFSRIGVKWVGFAPVKFPPGLRFAELYHGDNERIPVDGLAWGTEVLAEVVTSFANGPA